MVVYKWVVNVVKNRILHIQKQKAHILVYIKRLFEIIGCVLDI